MFLFAQVRFVDYGNSEWVGLDGVKTLKKQYCALPAQALQCCLDNISPRTGQWTEEDVAVFEELVYDKNLIAEVRHVTTQYY